MRGRWLLLLAAGAGSAAWGAEEHVNFLSCPVLRDTTPNCWTAQHDGETYFIGAQRGPSDSYLPQMKHQVLVEGVVTLEPRICGGIVLRPLRVSVITELDLTCDGPVLPADGLAPPPVPVRGSARSAAPASDVLGPVGSFMRTPVPQPPFTRQEFRIDFDFCSDVLTDQMQRRVIEILTCAATAQATAIAVKGYSAITLLSNGQRLEEPEGLAGQRARKIADVFVDLGAARERLRVEWADSHVQPDGKGDAARRRVMVTVVP
jgi:outer membrane protein OmpA-like peptidoglycan-associated protein